MSKDHPIADVSDTSFWVAYYRAKETDRGDSMFKDPFAKKLVGERGKTISDSMGDIGRYTEWSVVSRTVIIDRFIEKLIKEGVDAVINLGAGLDTRPFRLNLPPQLEWIEADYSHILAHKKQVLKDENPKCKLTQVEVDLASELERRKFFITVVPNSKKVLILTEGVLPYLDPSQVSALSNDLIDQTRLTYWITEYFHPKVYRYLKDSLRNQKMKNAPFKFYPDDWYGFFKNLGWVEYETRYGGEIAVQFKRTPPMPRWSRVLLSLMPEKWKQSAMRMTGYIVFKRST